MEWYYSSVDASGEPSQEGPENVAALRKLWSAKKIDIDTLVWHEDLPNWKAIRELPGLKSKLTGEVRKAPPLPSRRKPPPIKRGNGSAAPRRGPGPGKPQRQKSGEKNTKALDKAFLCMERAERAKARKKYEKAYRNYIDSAQLFLKALSHIKDPRSNNLVRCNLDDILAEAERMKEMITSAQAKKSGTRRTSIHANVPLLLVEGGTSDLDIGAGAADGDDTSPKAGGATGGGNGNGDGGSGGDGGEKSAGGASNGPGGGAAANGAKKGGNGAGGPPAPSSKRDRVVLEIYSTERTYVTSLQVLNDIYVEPLRTATTSSMFGGTTAIVKKVDWELMFGGITHILHLNTKFKSDIEQRVMSWDAGDEAKQRLGDVFVDFAPFFKMYRDYLNKFEKAQKRTFGLTAESKAFAKFLESAAKDPRAKGSNLQSLMILPIQRIPRYRMLVEELLKRTEASHPDYGDLSQGLKAIRAVADEVNASIRMHEAAMHIWTVQNQFTPRLELAAPGREFVREGMLQKINQKGGAQDRYFVLFSDILIYGSKLVDTPFDTFFARGEYRHHRTVRLHAVARLDETNDRDVDLASQYGARRAIRIITDSKSFVVVADDESTSESWYKCMSETIEKQKQRVQILQSRRGLIDGTVSQRSLATSGADFYNRAITTLSSGDVFTNASTGAPDAHAAAGARTSLSTSQFADLVGKVATKTKTRGAASPVSDGGGEDADAVSGTKRGGRPQQPQVSSKTIKAVAQWDFPPAGRTKEEGELQLRKGEKIFVTLQRSDGWWRGVSTTTREEGMFPGNYVAVVND